MIFCKRVLSFGVLLILLPLFAASTEAASDRVKYPPYPDVWGYDLSDYQAVRENRSYMDAYDSPDGDIVFIVKSEGIPGDDLSQDDFLPIGQGEAWKKDKYKAIKFFAQEIIDLPGFEEKYAFIENNKLVSHQEELYHAIRFEDGTQIKYYYDSAGKLCSHENLDRYKLIKGKPDADGILTSYHQGAEVYSVLVANPNIIRLYDNKGEPECPESGEVVYKQLRFMATNFVKLKDETFILYDDKANLILRFDKNLKTKFQPQHGVRGTKLKRNFFVIPHSVLNQVVDKYNSKEPWVQAMHDNTLKYLEEQEEKGKFDN